MAACASMACCLVVATSISARERASRVSKHLLLKFASSSKVSRTTASAAAARVLCSNSRVEERRRNSSMSSAVFMISSSVAIVWALMRSIAACSFKRSTPKVCRESLNSFSAAALEPMIASVCDLHICASRSNDSISEATTLAWTRRLCNASPSLPTASSISCSCLDAAATSEVCDKRASLNFCSNKARASDKSASFFSWKRFRCSSI
mmetsp:Transcript_17548/g.28503  ORF Transcript_17548/g.28503 Transcript_17548/m.28503 type:complete len:208 (-) Transcript_17548:370-993(-)